MGDPALWLQVAIESGLVEMGSLEKDIRVRDILSPIGDEEAPAPQLPRGELQRLLMEGTINTLAEMDRRGILKDKSTSAPEVKKAIKKVSKKANKGK